jgi:hypothetical protein
MKRTVVCLIAIILITATSSVIHAIPLYHTFEESRLDYIFHFQINFDAPGITIQNDGTIVTLVDTEFEYPPIYADWTGDDYFYVEYIGGSAPLHVSDRDYYGHSRNGPEDSYINSNGIIIEGQSSDNGYGLFNPYLVSKWSVGDEMLFGLTSGHEVWTNLNLFEGTLASISESNPIPEPATMLLLGIGLSCLVGIGRKKFL